VIKKVFVFLVILLLVINYNHYDLPIDLSYDLDKQIESISTIKNEWYKYDKSLDKLSDYSKFELGYSTYILVLKSSPSKSLLNKIEAFGFQIGNYLENLNYLVVRGNLENIPLLQKLNEVLFIEENGPIQSHLAYSNSQSNIRPYFWDYGIFGSSSSSVAILDSGIDANHPLVKDRVIAWKDFAGKNMNNRDEVYKDPIDLDGHGTHVASIVAGSTGSVPTTHSIAFASRFPEQGFSTIALSTPYRSSTHSITVGLDWGAKGSDSSVNSVDIIVTSVDNFNQAVVPLTTISGGLANVTINNIPAGSHFIWISGGTEDQYFEGWVDIQSYDNVPSKNDGYHAYQGGAPGANIVAVKVLDDSGSGDVEILLDGVDWILNNYQTYNISVVNLSLGGSIIFGVLDNAVKTLADNGILSVVAAGNEGPSANMIGSPGSSDYAITVGAVNRANEIAFYSSKGSPTFNPNVKPDVVAPGGSYTIKGFPGHETSYDGGWGFINAAKSNYAGYNSKPDALIGQIGTSMAAPHVAALALLLIDLMKNQGEWENNLNSVLKIKQLITSTTFETANIGFGGDKLNNNPRATPTIERTGKDYFEGWGMINGKGALDLLTMPLALNEKISIEMNLENVFVPNSFGRYLDVVAGETYVFNLETTSSADLDLLIISSNPSTFGEPVFVATSTVFGGDQSLIFEATTTERVYVVVKLVDAPEGSLTADLTVISDFIPSMSISSELGGSYINSNNFKIEFQSTTGFASLLINSEFKQNIRSGQQLSLSLAEGAHNFTLIETNTKTGESASVSFTLINDFTPPNIEWIISNTTVFEDFWISYNVTDNFEVKSIVLLAGDRVIHETTEMIGNFTTIANHFLPGSTDIKIIATDKALNQAIQTQEITFTHQTYLLPKGDVLIHSGENFENIEWVAGAEDPNQYEIKVNGDVVESGNWDGNNIIYEIDRSELAEYIIEVTISDNTGLSVNTISKITVVDLTPPSITASINTGTYDPTNDLDLKITINDFMISSVSVDIDEETSIHTNINDKTFTLDYTLLGIPNTITTVEIIATDTSGNENTRIIIIEWVDETRPIIRSPGNLRLTTAELDQEIEWTWTEKFQRDVLVELNGVIIFNQETSTIKSYSYDLSNLEVGNNLFKLEVTDTSNNSAFSLVSVRVTQAEGDDETQLGFLSIRGFIIGVIVLTLIARKYRNFIS
jgi:hypothetical protein